MSNALAPISLRTLQAYAQDEAWRAEAAAAAYLSDPAYVRAAEANAHRARMLMAVTLLCTALIARDKAGTREMIDKGIAV